MIKRMFFFGIPLGILASVIALAVIAWLRQPWRIEIPRGRS
jgi:hypothetical protein